MKYEILKVVFLIVTVLLTGSVLGLVEGETGSNDVSARAVTSTLSQEADTTSEVTAPDSAKIMLEKKVTDLLRRSCAISGCHRGKSPKKGLNLESELMREALVDIPSRQAKDKKLVDTKDPGTSYLLMKITGTKGISGKKMPIWGAPLTTEEIAIIERWIESLQTPIETPADNSEE